MKKDLSKTPEYHQFDSELEAELQEFEQICADIEQDWEPYLQLFDQGEVLSRKFLEKGYLKFGNPEQFLAFGLYSIAEDLLVRNPTALKNFSDITAIVDSLSQVYASYAALPKGSYYFSPAAGGQILHKENPQLIIPFDGELRPFKYVGQDGVRVLATDRSLFGDNLPSPAILNASLEYISRDVRDVYELVRSSRSA